MFVWFHFLYYSPIELPLDEVYSQAKPKSFSHLYKSLIRTLVFWLTGSSFTFETHNRQKEQVSCKNVIKPIIFEGFLILTRCKFD